MSIFVPRPGDAGREAAHPAPRRGILTLPGTLTAARLKVTNILDAAELNAIKVPRDKLRITLRIRLPDRTITAEIAAKSLCKAPTALREAGADNALVLQAELFTGDVIAEAGSAHPKAAKPAPRSEALKINHGSAAKCVEAP